WTATGRPRCSLIHLAPVRLVQRPPSGAGPASEAGTRSSAARAARAAVSRRRPDCDRGPLLRLLPPGRLPRSDHVGCARSP
ncbi:MAG: hypothetical protein AVDCRST_MAG33-3375, partial [uncultured Thermomicrobiales bacterium]